MGGQYGIEELKKIVGLVAEILNVVSKIINKQGFFALFGLLKPLQDLQGVNWPVALKELGEVDGQERKDVEAAFQAKLDLVDKVAQAKIVTGIGYVEKSAELVAKGVSMVGEGVALVKEIKAFLGV